ncbi:MAG: alpha/beta hydrolase fold domain-containing protein [Pseudonocardiaceae bacterium]|nr:alpha/beta hydrolase fold domain-containing protein [Pseudonocardiaceae bacterium]
MGLDPQLRAVFDRLDELGALPLTRGSATENRQRYRDLALARRGPDYVPEPVSEVGEATVDGPGGPIPVRIYRPADPTAAVTYLHGGGWVVGDLDTHDPVCRRVANALDAVVVSVGYRLAPEHPFPAALDDTVAALRWTAQQHPELPLGVAGDSAGGSLAAGAALRARDEGGPALAGQLLIYPGTDTSLSQQSVTTNGEGYFLTASDMRWFVDQYLPTPELRADPLADLLRAPDLSGLAPAVVATAEFDPLRDEGNAYADRLREADVTVCTLPGATLAHGYFNLAELVDAAREQREDVLDAFAALLAS